MQELPMAESTSDKNKILDSKKRTEGEVGKRGFFFFVCSFLFCKITFNGLKFQRSPLAISHDDIVSIHWKYLHPPQILEILVAIFLVWAWIQSLERNIH